MTLAPPQRVVGLHAAQARFGDLAAAVAALYGVGDPAPPDRPDPPPAPPWLDPHRLDVAGLALRRHGLLTAVVLRCYALLLSYRSPVGVLPLVHTGRLVAEAPARLYRTAAMVTETQQPGALHPGGPAWRTAAAVRRGHEAVRRSLVAAGWRTEQLGAPIPQPDLAATALLFGPLTVEGLRRLGARISEEEADAVAHLSRAMAHGQGVVDALLTDTHEEALRLFACITALHGPPSSDGRALTHALIQVPHALATTPLDRAVAPLLVRLYQSLAVATLGASDASALGLSGAPTWAGLVRGLAALPGLHHRRLAPAHDRLVRAVIARGRARLGASGLESPPAAPAA